MSISSGPSLTEARRGLKGDVITDLVFNHSETCQILLGQLTPQEKTVVVHGEMTSNYLDNQLNSFRLDDGRTRPMLRPSIQY